MIRVKRYIFAFCAFIALGTFVFVYANLWNFVGRFPAESLTVGNPKSNAALALCFRPGYNSAQFSTFAVDGLAKPLRGPSLKLAPNVPESDLRGLANSRSLAYAVDRNAVYSINPIDGEAMDRLRGFAFWGLSNEKAVSHFVRATQKIYPDCPAPASDRGLTEAYWATKGTGVIHHWGFLYDASVFDGKPIHAQYGTFVSAIAHGIASASGLAGPTGFVRVAWWVFCLIGIAAGSALYYVFSRTPAVAALAVSGQTLAFVTLGSFSILLAPGYHWTREFVIVAPLLLLAVLKRIQPASRWRAVLICVAAFASCDIIDPSFALFAFFCLALAVAIRERLRIADLVTRAPQIAAYAALAVGAIVIAFLIIDRSNLSYVFSEVIMFSGSAVVNQNRNNVFLFDGVLVALALIVSWLRRTEVALPYFALVSVVVFLYYAVTPDNFHYGKYVAFTIPLYAAFGAVLYRLIGARFARARPAIDAACAVVSLVMCGSAVAQLVSVGPEWQLRTYDADLRAYFSSTPVTINGRLIDADLNGQTVKRLATFPASLPYDYLVSPLDKYVLFLYDRHNGFDDIDNTSTMTDDGRLAKLEAALTKPGRRTILDSETFVANPLAGLLSNHPVFGSIDDQSVINQKERVRYNELAGRLLHSCASRSVDADRHWFYVRC